MPDLDLSQGIVIDPNKPKEEQKLIVSFVRDKNDKCTVSINFEPSIDIPNTSAQGAAVSVANLIIDHYGLDKGGEQNAEPSDKVH